MFTEAPSRYCVQGDIFEVIKKGDILLHHPYHSFVTSTQHFVEAAASDPKVRNHTVETINMEPVNQQVKHLHDVCKMV